MPYDANDRETYYSYHSLRKRGKGTCKPPRLNAKKFEERDGVARDQRERLGSIDGELEEVKKQLGLVRPN